MLPERAAMESKIHFGEGEEYIILEKANILRYIKRTPICIKCKTIFFTLLSSSKALARLMCQLLGTMLQKRLDQLSKKSDQRSKKYALWRKIEKMESILPREEMAMGRADNTPQICMTAEMGKVINLSISTGIGQ